MLISGWSASRRRAESATGSQPEAPIQLGAGLPAGDALTALLVSATVGLLIGKPDAVKRHRLFRHANLTPCSPGLAPRRLSRGAIFIARIEHTLPREGGSGMQFRKTGRTLPVAALASAKRAALAALAALAFVVTLAGCARHGATTGTNSTDATSAAPGDGSAQGGSYQSEAERTKAMEEKARELDKKAAEIQNMQGSEQEKTDAVNKLEQERQELHNMSGDGSTPANPPPQ